jgi:hypothetical protein
MRPTLPGIGRTGLSISRPGNGCGVCDTPTDLTRQCPRAFTDTIECPGQGTKLLATITYGDFDYGFEAALP